MTDRLKKQIEFIMEVDKLKSILRQSLTFDGTRRENDAEHSWHLAMMAMVLQEYAAVPVDLSRVLQMAIVHDLIEIYAGDTFAYDARANLDKERREQEAADRLFSMLPNDQGAAYRSLWEEFDAAQTPDAIFAACLDRLQPLLANHATNGHTWRLTPEPIKKEQVYRRNAPMQEGAPALWELVEQIIRDSMDKGYLSE